ncbi:MAG: 30S ribosomal protein S2 [Candidatus Zambryskibacteria bacterium CG_4_9_14_3_um_filter_40_16]|uniref:Small ribosomal subunit protein uS2 n=2 Tax=Candidatus Zambryskiibacteriota TaxID=1817925 RepID=A0A2H0K6L1_9BACT|nr:MAG: 30S ribosomal protein S2 [Candidatus Zambryskibacteria bacterium CG11_big_fil_rev_8_21_14_0_20_40_24]PJA33906.1 MAG: 30S ribosomal protein S2 [Candidatus Zambryskibacteria bacterium CG_4_9_14_3_um_filter_40_16]
MNAKEKQKNDKIEGLFKVGAHFGMIKSRRHPSTKGYIFGAKNKVEIFDLGKTVEALERAKEAVRSVAENNGAMLIVGGKNEAQRAVSNAGESLQAPYVAGRWLGGTLTNFSEIRKRINKLEDLLSQKEKGELAKYTKKERLLIDRDIVYLQKFFSSLITLKGLPKLMFVIDPKREHIAVAEALNLNIPIVALASSDCNVREIDYPIPANDSSAASIAYFVNEIAQAYQKGKQDAPSTTEKTKVD